MKNSLKISLISLSLLVSANTFSEDINCSDGTCTYDPSFDIVNESNTSTFTQFDIRNVLSDVLIQSQNGASPRNVKFSITSIEGDAKDVTINLPSFKAMNSGGSAVMIGDTVKNLSLNISGRNGDASANASVICANRILNGIYGNTIKSKFLLARINNPSLPADKCTDFDIGQIQGDQFGCNPGSSEIVGQNISARRWMKRRSCESRSVRNMCVAKRVKITCTWLAQKFAGKTSCLGTVPAGNATLNPSPRGGGAYGKQWTCDPALANNDHSGWKITFNPFNQDESWLLARKNAGKSDEIICDELTGRDSTYLSSFYELTASYYFSGPGRARVHMGYSAPGVKGSLEVNRGYFHGYHQKTLLGNPIRVIPTPNVGFALDATTKPCGSAYTKTGAHFESRLMNTPCRNVRPLKVMDLVQEGVDSENYPRNTYNSRFWEENCTKPGATHECRMCASQPFYKGQYIQCFGETTFSYRGLVLDTTQVYNVPNPSGIMSASSIRNQGFPYSFDYMQQTYVSNGPFSGGGNYVDNYALATGAQHMIRFSDYPYYPAGMQGDYIDFLRTEQPLPVTTTSGDHMYKFPTSINCWLQSVDGVDCSNTQMGEAFGISYMLKLDLYAPNGRIIDYRIKWSLGRY